jgi:hypothetical protein
MTKSNNIGQPIRKTAVGLLHGGYNFRCCTKNLYTNERKLIFLQRLNHKLCRLGIGGFSYCLHQHLMRN